MIHGWNSTVAAACTVINYSVLMKQPHIHSKYIVRVSPPIPTHRVVVFVVDQVPPEDRNAPAEDLMIPVDEIPCLSLECTGRQASDVASLCQPGQIIPVVQSM